MFATKETFVLTLTAMAFALVATRFWNGWRARCLGGASASVPQLNWLPPPRHTLLALAVTGGVWLLLFSSFFTNASGLVDSVKTYLPWLHRASGASPHIHPWNFYLERLIWFHPPKSPVWSEALILLLAVIGGGVAFCNNPDLRGQPTLARFLTFYTLALTAIYTLISYKTPWCLLNFWLGMILLAGIGAAALVQLCRSTPSKLFMATALAIGVMHLGTQAWRAAVTQAADPRNPYVYAQTKDACRQR